MIDPNMILSNYPPELIHEIFNNLAIQDVINLTGDKEIGQFAFQRKYDKLLLLREVDFEFVSRNFVMVSVERLLELVSLQFFRPGGILLDHDDFVHVDMSHPRLFSKFKNIEHFTKLTSKRELENLSKYNNLNSVFIYDFERINRKLSLYAFPQSLLSLRILDIAIDAPFPTTLTKLSMSRCTLKVSQLPSHLKSLDMHDTVIELDLQLPKSLTDLRIYLDIPKHHSKICDFSYLNNLNTLSLEGIDLEFLQLPLSLTFLSVSNCGKRVRLYV